MYNGVLSVHNCGTGFSERNQARRVAAPIHAVDSTFRPSVHPGVNFHLPMGAYSSRPVEDFHDLKGRKIQVVGHAGAGKV